MSSCFSVYWLLSTSYLNYMPQILNAGNKILLDDARMADSRLKRLIGLMFRKSIPDNQALIFYRAGEIHTFFMLMPIDIIFLDKSMEVIKLRENVPPMRIVFCRKSFYTIECAAGLSAAKGIKEGDTLIIKNG